jgi:hypothetical protein
MSAAPTCFKLDVQVTALALAILRPTNVKVKAAKAPIIAITTISSTKVNPAFGYVEDVLG